MTVCLVMIVKNEQAVIERCLTSALPLIDSWCIVDTGSTDGTKEIVREILAEIPGKLHEREWDGYAPSLNAAFALARDEGDWLLRLDADMTVDAHPDLMPWLATNAEPAVDAWNVFINDHELAYRLPLLLRGGLVWEWRGSAHEWLDAPGRHTRSLLGLTVHHFHDGGNQDGRFERYLELLAVDCAAGEPRAVFYTAESLRFLGRNDEAIEMYERRAALGGFEEERWFATYQAARLRGSIDLLLAAWRQRPHRHEPLTAAALIVAEAENDDILFVQPAGRA